MADATLSDRIRELSKAKQEIERMLGIRMEYSSNATGTSSVTLMVTQSYSVKAFNDTEALKSAAKRLEDTYSLAYPDIFADLSSDALASMGCLGAITFITDQDFGKKLTSVLKKLDEEIRRMRAVHKTSVYPDAGESPTWQKAKASFGSPYNSRYTDSDSTELDIENDFIASRQLLQQDVLLRCTAIVNGTPVSNENGEMPALTEAIKASANPMKPTSELFNKSASQYIVEKMYATGVRFCSAKMNTGDYSAADYTAAKANPKTPEDVTDAPTITGSVFMKTGAYVEFSKSMAVSLATMEFSFSEELYRHWKDVVASQTASLHASGDMAAVMKAFAALQRSKSAIDSGTRLKA